MKVSVIFTETLKLLKSGTRRIVNQGGQSSGKTVNILGALATIASEKPVVITVTSMSFPHLKAGAMRDFERFVMPSFAETIKQYRKTDHVCLFESGGLIEFKTYETEFDARGGKRDILFVNEANTFDYMTWWQLDTRSTQSIIDYNPTIRFWAHEKVIGKTGTELRISNHLHNPFLSDDKHLEIENFCVFDRDEKGNIQYNEKGKPIIISGDYELYKVYAKGLTGNVTGLIYPNWVMVEDIDWREPFFAVDFGYTNDPTAIVKIERMQEHIYAEEIGYKTGSMGARVIRDILEANGYTDESVVYCEHDPQMIKQLKLLGIRAIAAQKKSGSLNAGIAKLKEYKVFYCGEHIKKETQMYIWEVDETGKTTNKPVDANNHLLDAIRYGVYSHFYRSQNQEE